MSTELPKIIKLGERLSVIQREEDSHDYVSDGGEYVSLYVGGGPHKANCCLDGVFSPIELRRIADAMEGKFWDGISE